jgi:hypothetical protein
MKVYLVLAGYDYEGVFDIFAYQNKRDADMKADEMLDSPAYRGSTGFVKVIEQEILGAFVPNDAAVSSGDDQ